MLCCALSVAARCCCACPRRPSQATPGSSSDWPRPQFEDTPLAPAAFRRVRSTVKADGVHSELLVSASAVHALVGSLDYNSAEVLFDVAAGVVVDGTLYRITSATSAEAFGEVYLYRLGLLSTAPL